MKCKQDSKYNRRPLLGESDFATRLLISSVRATVLFVDGGCGRRVESPGTAIRFALSSSTKARSNSFANINAYSTNRIYCTKEPN